VNLLGERFTRLWPVDNAPKFEELLEAIDDADRRLAEARRHEMKAGPTPE